MKSQHGQNVSEYGIAVGLIVIVCISVVGVIGSNVSQMFSGSIQHKSATKTTTQATTGSGTATSQTVSTASGNPFAGVASRTVTMALGNGKSISFSAPALDEVVDTAGGNGATGRSAYMIQQIADQLKSEGVISPQEYADLVKLSQLGFEMRDVQAALEKKIPVGMNTQDGDSFQKFMAETMIDYKGQTYSYGKLSATLTATTTSKESSDPAGQLGSAFNMTLSAPNTVATFDPGPGKDFMLLLNKIDNSATFQNNPLLRELVVQNLSKEIFKSISLTNSVFDKNELKNVLIPITGQNSEAICDLSNSISCQSNS